jgi:hypothetical protein
MSHCVFEPKHQNPWARHVSANPVTDEASAIVSIDDALPADSKFDAYAFALALLDED